MSEYVIVRVPITPLSLRRTAAGAEPRRSERAKQATVGVGSSDLVGPLTAGDPARSNA